MDIYGNVEQDGYGLKSIDRWTLHLFEKIADGSFFGEVADIEVEVSEIRNNFENLRQMPTFKDFVDPSKEIMFETGLTELELQYAYVHLRNAFSKKIDMIEEIFSNLSNFTLDTEIIMSDISKFQGNQRSMINYISSEISDLAEMIVKQLGIDINKIEEKPFNLRRSISDYITRNGLYPVHEYYKSLLYNLDKELNKTKYNSPNLISDEEKSKDPRFNLRFNIFNRQ